MSTLFLILLLVNAMALIVVFFIAKSFAVPRYVKQFLIALLSVLCFLYIKNDVQELKKEKHALKEQQAIYQKIIQSNP